ncbi:MAG: glycoside hydrolase family 3 C-terminal domain-containing protein [Verrucomicrobia bacterium]|nr:glycoside hydrolase family 3 C-terminal domain-containing protein [Verrucomicrobiota bacterium]
MNRTTPTPCSRRDFLQLAGLAVGVHWMPAAVAATPLPDFKSLTLEQQVGQMVIARLQDWPLMERYAKQGLFSGMTPSLTKLSPAEVVEFTNRFQKLSPIPLLFGWGGVSYGGGTEVRLQQTMRIGATRNAALCREAARIEAAESRALGFQLAGAPVLDVNLNPDNTIINLRSISDDVELVTTLGAALAQGTLDGGAAPIFMHFPGHGATRGDSHIEMPEAARSLAELEAVELKPFATLIRRGLARVICTNHCYYPALEPDRKIPATLSRRIITGLLREKLGYEGVIMSDSLTMRPIKENYGIEEAAIETVRVGHDLILQDYRSDPQITLDALVRAVRQGRIPLAQVEQSVKRVWKLKRELGLFEQRLVDPAKLPQVFATKASVELARRIARESVTLLENSADPLRAVAKPVVCVISNGSAATVDEDNAVKHSPTNHYLNEQIRQRLPGAQSVVLSTAMKPAEVERAFAAAQKADVVVFGLFTRVRSYVEDAIRIPKPFRELIERAVAAGRTVALLNFGNPYVMADLPKAGISLCTFSDASDSIDAAVQVLFGELKPQGLLPVRISARYPFGHGLKA